MNADSGGFKGGHGLSAKTIKLNSKFQGAPCLNSYSYLEGVGMVLILSTEPLKDYNCDLCN